MPTARTRSYANIGIKAVAIDIEVHVSAGLPAFNIVGMAETAVRESRERVRSAIINSHFEFPPRRITVNLAPADLPKQGGGFDLAIALGVLAATGQIPLEDNNKYAYSGELSLLGALRPVRGMLPVAISCIKDNRTLICASGSQLELELLEKGDEILPAGDLLEVCAHLQGRQALPPIEKPATNQTASPDTASLLDLKDIRGQQAAKKALEIAAAGGHNLLFTGPPGAGKSMLAKRMPGILPNLDNQSAIETAVIYSICGKSRESCLSPPVRSPHHSASSVSLVGGGSPPVPGEVSLAHKGLLFLDELPEFAPKVLEGLREPLENGEITISRASHQSLFPADFILVAAMNPCPCGFYGSPSCDCSTEQVNRYQRRVSGPLLDRIDMQVLVELPTPGELIRTQSTQGESSSEVKQRVIEARNRQLNRQGKINAHLSAEELSKVASLSNEAELLLSRAMENMDLSARGLHKVLRVARSIADLENQDFSIIHIKQALGFRERKISK